MTESLKLNLPLTLKYGARPGCLLLLSNIILDILDDLIRQEKNKRLKKIGSETSGMAVREVWHIPPAKQLFNG